MMQLSNVTVRSPTCSEFGPVNFATPWMTSTLRCLASPSRPFVSLSTTDCFHERSAPRSIDGLPNEIPWAAISSVSAITRAACSSAFEGMQPTFRHTPPSFS